MQYLVTGGAGYIGSHTALALIEQGHDVTVLDNLSTGHEQAVPKGARFVHIDLADKEALDAFLAKSRFDAVLHFAALSQVGDSMKSPYHYLRQNTLTSLNLIESCVEHGVKRFVFSSTAALFGGEDLETPIKADAPINPGSPYGESKLFIERALKWADRIHGLKYAVLRYFNAAGADPKGRLGEDHRPETHLIPLTVDTALNRRDKLKIFGNDYATKDGTCIRDYIHVTDLAEAHIRALKHVTDNEQSVTYNLGNGVGFSNADIVASVQRVVGKSLSWEYAPRRAGDPAVLIADSEQIKRDTGWAPQYADIDTIVETAVNWRVTHPCGYKS